MQSLEPKSFDYDDLDLDTRIYLQQQEYDIKSLLQSTWIDIGLRLDEVKKMLPHGTFQAWMQARFSKENGLAPTSAERMLSAARAVLNHASENCNLRLLPISKCAGYELPSLPDFAQKEAISRAESGEELTRAKVLEMKARYQSGDTVLVQGSPVTILGVEGKILTTDKGVFLPGHLDGAKIPQERSPSVQPLHPIAKLESRLEFAKAREDYLVDLLRQVYAVMEGRSLATVELISEVRDAIT